MKPLSLESSALRIDFDPAAATIATLHNKLTGETCGVSGDQFAIQLDEWVWCQNDFQLLEAQVGGRALCARYGIPSPPPSPGADAFRQIEVTYTLGDAGHFVEKRLAFTVGKAGALRRVVVSAPHFRADGLRVVCYRHPAFERIEAQQAGVCRREPGAEPVKTYFGRTPRGGFFAGLEMPFDVSALNGNQVQLSFKPSLKLRAGQALACDAAYFGVYARHALDARADAWRPHDMPEPTVLPLPSESLAMTAMVRSSFGAPRFGMVAIACGWHCQMEQGEYTPQSLAGDLKSLDFLAECGVEWVSDSHPWAGETAKMNAMTGDDRYELGELPRRFLQHARELGLKVVQWPTMNHTHPWSGIGQSSAPLVPGKPFRSDRPDWLRGPTAPAVTQRPGESFRGDFHAAPANCLANRPFFEWVRSLIFQALETGLYGAWCMDGDFFGPYAGVGYSNATVPAECTSDQHDHLVADANYACQKALDELTAAVRHHYPHLYVALCRPPMDLGVWSNRYADACFTLIETGSGQSNIAGGDEIRLASRIRVHHHFFPHTMDWPLLFPSYQDPRQVPPWPSAKLDYILLSAMSSAPNLLMYFPTKTGIPDADKREIRRWLDWGRKNQAYLMVRHDLPDWPAPGKVDGSAHVLGDRGLIFLFNPNPQAKKGRFTLNADGLGVTQGKRFLLSQSHPGEKKQRTCAWNEEVEWEVAPETALVLELAPG